MSDARRVAEDTPSARDRAVNVVRLAALVIVMFGHGALLLATRHRRSADRQPARRAADDRPITWIVQVMPLFFLAGGAAGAYGWHTGTPWGTWRFTRSQRLCRPVFWYLVAWSTGLLVAHVILDRGPVMTLDHPAVASACCSLWD